MAYKIILTFITDQCLIIVIFQTYWFLSQTHATIKTLSLFPFEKNSTPCYRIPYFLINPKLLTGFTLHKNESTFLGT